MEFVDMTPYSTEGKGASRFRVGWLGRNKPFTTGAISDRQLECLRDLCRRPVRLHKGHHPCDLCTRAARRMPLRVDGSYGPPFLGNGEIHVTDREGATYVAPALIYHYVRDHSYLPPERFLMALEDACNPS